MTAILILMGLLLMSWVIFCGIQVFRISRSAFAENNIKIHAKCEKCGREYEVTAADFAMSYGVKYKSVTRTRMRGIAAVNEPQFTYYAKKLYCPYCKRRKYAQIINLNEIQDTSVSSIVKAGKKWMAAMVAGGVLILDVMGGITSVVFKHNEEKTENIRQQRYVDLKQKYRLDE